MTILVGIVIGLKTVNNVILCNLGSIVLTVARKIVDLLERVQIPLGPPKYINDVNGTCAHWIARQMIPDKTC